MNNIEKVKELIATKLSKDIEYYRQVDSRAVARGHKPDDGYIARGEETARKKALETQAAYDNRDSAISWAEDILAQFNFTFDGISEDGLSYIRAGGEHTRGMAVFLDYGRSRRPWTPSFHVTTDKTNKYYAIKNNFAKQIGRRVEERESIEEHFAGLKSGAYQQQADVKAAFEKARAAADDPSTSLKSEMVDNRHVFSMDFAGRDVPLRYNEYDQSLLVTVAFSAGGSESRIEKTMLLQEFLESELIHIIYFESALA